MKKKMPTFNTDAEAERFVDTADLTEYDLSNLIPTRFEFEKKTAQLNMRLPKPLLEAVKKRSLARGIPYTRFIREAVEMALARPGLRLQKRLTQGEAAGRLKASQSYHPSVESGPRPDEIAPDETVVKRMRLRSDSAAAGGIKAGRRK
jgi:predicted DNA binding CopG/RHH family protein